MTHLPIYFIASSIICMLMLLTRSYYFIKLWQNKDSLSDALQKTFFKDGISKFMFPLSTEEPIHDTAIKKIFKKINFYSNFMLMFFILSFILGIYDK